MSAAGLAAGAGRRTRLRIGAIWSASLLVILAFLVVYPVFMLIVGALTGGDPVVDGYQLATLSPVRFIAVLSNENVHLALLNSLITCLGVRRSRWWSGWRSRGSWCGRIRRRSG